MRKIAKWAQWGIAALISVTLLLLSLLALLVDRMRRPTPSLPERCDLERRGRNFDQLFNRSATLLAIALFIAVTLGGSLLIWPRWHATTPKPLIHSSQLAESPSLPPEIVEELDRQRAENEQRLMDYGWSDRDTGGAHIPIERAMELITGSE